MPMSTAREVRVGLLVCVVAAIVYRFLSAERFGQNIHYHDFADKRMLIEGVPNTLDVLSNLPFLFVGFAGLHYMCTAGRPRPNGSIRNRWQWVVGFVFFCGEVLTCFGSCYYHWHPDNETLVWDRIPMTLAFTAILCGVMGERVWDRVGEMLLGPMLIGGIGSVVYWHVTELHGVGDLRPYYIVQFGSLISCVVMVVLFPPRYTGTKEQLFAAVLYYFAKVLESYDKAIFAMTGGVVSGHTLKHLVAAWATYQMLRLLRGRAHLPRRDRSVSK